VGALASMEPTMKHQPDHTLTLTGRCETNDGTVADGQFDWGGRLLKGNGGVQRLAQAEWKPAAECKGTSQLDCKADAPSRDESRA
jgi:hypothetical protein